MIIIGIYKIQSKIKPERFYIGSAVNFRKRKILHLHLLRNNKHANKKLQNHYNKYGEDDLSFILLGEYNKDKLIDAEQFFIDIYNPYFNICKKAYSTIGRKMSDETKKKLSEAKKGVKKRPFSEEARKNMSEAGKNRPPITEETRIKLRNKNKGVNNPNYGKKISEYHKQKIRESNTKHKTGKHLSEEAKKKISLAVKGYKHSEETKQKMRGRKLSEEHKAKMSEAHKKRWAKIKNKLNN